MTQMVVLVVDDDGDSRFVFEASLIHFGYSVVTALNGRDALVKGSRCAPDLILMDLEMPDMDGWEAARLLKADSATAAIPIIAVTAQDRAAPELRNAGFHGYIRKPVAPRELARAVDLCLERRGERQPWIHLPSFASPLPPAR